MKENFAETVKQANLARKNYIADFVKNIDFDKKLKNINKRVTSNEKTVNDHITSYTNLINDLSREVKLISTKVLIKVLISIDSVLNDTKYFAEHGN